MNWHMRKSIEQEKIDDALILKKLNLDKHDEKIP